MDTAKLCDDIVGAGVSTSSYGQGNSHYGDTAPDLMEPFAEEFDLISRIFVRLLQLSIAAPEGVKVTLFNDYCALCWRGPGRQQ